MAQAMQQLTMREREWASDGAAIGRERACAIADATINHSRERESVRVIARERHWPQELLNGDDGDGVNQMVTATEEWNATINHSTPWRRWRRYKIIFILLNNIVLMKNINHDNDGSYKIIFILFYTILMKNVKLDRLRTTYMLPWMQPARPHISLEYKITIITCKH
jgi:hypothetical protein